jgi:hypothetical protein
MPDQPLQERDIAGSQGWREFLGEKQELLAEFQLARRRAANRPIQTEPGEVAEAVFRRWLGRFLPARYGITSGFLISAGLSDRRPLRHYDVIIYDKANSPVLWRGGQPDRSDQGTTLALPVEYVHAVFEVKATLTSDSVREAAEKLDELAPLLSETDLPGTPYPFYLPASFACGVVFFQTDHSARGRHLTPLAELSARLQRGFMGGIVLSTDADPTDDEAARLVLLQDSGMPQSENESTNQHIYTKERAFSRYAQTPKGALTVGIEWSINEFGHFAHDLVAILAGKFRIGEFSSLHGVALRTSTFPIDPVDEAGELARKKRRQRRDETNAKPAAEA